jgi:hypothetical protein
LTVLLDGHPRKAFFEEAVLMSFRAVHARAQEFACAVIRDHAHLDGNHAVIHRSQASLAEYYRISPSTIAWYLNELGPAVVSRRPLTLVVPSVSERPNLDTLIARAETLMDELVVTLRAIRSCESADGPADFPRETATGPRISATGPPNSATEPRVSATGPRIARGSLDPFDKEVEEIPSYLPLAVAVPRETPADPRPLTVRTDAALARLLDPIERLVQARHLQPVNNRRRLAEALSHYTDAEVQAAVRELCEEVRRSGVIRSPYGLLINRAETRDASFLVPPDVLDECGNETDEPPPDFADSAIERMVAEPDCFATELAALDDLVAEHLAATNPTMVGRVAANGPLRNALRAEIYRTQHTTSERTAS